MPHLGTPSIHCDNGPKDMGVYFQSYEGHGWFRVGGEYADCLNIYITPEHWDHFRSEMLMALRVADEHYAPLLGRKSEGDVLQEESLAREADEALLSVPTQADIDAADKAYRNYHDAMASSHAGE